MAHGQTHENPEKKNYHLILTKRMKYWLTLTDVIDQLEPS